MRLRLVAVAALLSACQLALPDGTPDAPTGNPITGGQISVTALDAPTDALPPATAQRPPAPQPPDATPAATVAPDLAPAVVPSAPKVVAPVVATVAAQQKSASQIACEKSKGNWVAAGTTGTMICQSPLRDGGKQCARKNDCEGECLARSRSCAPFAPLFGCNEVLQNNGQRVTLCIE